LDIAPTWRCSDFRLFPKLKEYELKLLLLFYYYYYYYCCCFYFYYYYFIL